MERINQLLTCKCISDNVVMRGFEYFVLIKRLNVFHGSRKGRTVPLVHTKPRPSGQKTNVLKYGMQKWISGVKSQILQQTNKGQQ